MSWSRALLAASALLVAMSAVASAPDAAQATPPDVREYIVQPGDSVWSIAEAFYGSGEHYKTIYKFNKFVGRPPYILQPGQVLRLPVRDNLPEAQVDWLKREVKAKPPRSLDWLDARRQMNLWKLYKVSTGDESAVHIIFEDDSDLRLGDNALLVIYGGSSDKARSRARRGSRVVLDKGTIRGGLAKLDGDAAPMKVDTPSGRVDLYSRQVQVQATSSASMVSVYDGKADVSAQGATVEVPKGMGTVVNKGKRPQKPRPLPAVPGWAIGGSGDAVALVVPGGKASFEAAWEPVKRAATYRVELATDAAFKRPLYDIEVAGDITRMRLQDLGPGSYFARIAALDAARLEGQPSEVLPLRVVGVGSSRALTPLQGGGYETVAFTRLTLPAEAAGGFEWRLDDGAWEPGPTPLRLRGAGAHEVLVRRAGGSRETSLTVKVRGVTARIEVPEEPLALDGEAAEVVVTLADERGRPADLPGLTLYAQPGGALDLEARGGGRYAALVPAPTRRVEAVALRASWAFGVLGTEVIAVAAPPEAVPYRYGWGDSRIGLRWARRALATALPDVAPIDRFRVRATVVAPGGDAPAHLGFSLGGELALLVGALGLDAEVAVMRMPLSEERAGPGAGLGDAELGARLLLLRGERLSLGPSVRVRLPLAVRREQARLVGLEPGLLARVVLVEGLWLDVRQAVVYASDFGDRGGRLSYVGDYALAARPLDVLSLFAELNTAVSLAEPDGGEPFTAFGLGAGLQLQVDRARLGLAVGAGLGGGGRGELGALYGGLSVEFGLGGPQGAP